VYRIKEANNLFVHQNLEEVQWLINKVLEITGPPKVVLEIGVSHGGTLKYWEQISEEGALIIGVETNVRGLITWDIESSDRDIRYVQGNSHSPETLSRVEDILDGKAVDFLFIDGDHEGIKADYEDYSKRVRNGGIVGFHDVGGGGPCRQFFDEIKVPEHPSVVGKELFHRTIGIGYVIMLTTGNQERM